jgi:glycosyltransferase involved in cell wall biosynthesis
MVKKKICFITAVPETATSFLKSHISALSKIYSVHYICNAPDKSVVDVGCEEFFNIEIERKISIRKDIKALIKLYCLFKRQRYDSVHSVTPKAGLLTAIAAWLASVPVRIHIFTGQVWANMRGWRRVLFKSIDKLIVLLDTDILVDGEGQRKYLIRNNILRESNSYVMGDGSICGVDTERFSPSDDARNSIRKQLKIGGEKTVIEFLGRLNKDKGLYDLLPVFNEIVVEVKDAYLLLVGPDEEKVLDHIVEYSNIKSGVNYKYYGVTTSPELLLQAADIFVLPTYREGFGSSVIEASAMGLPVVCSNAYGVMDAMVDNVTGLRCDVGDKGSLKKCLIRLIRDPYLRQQLGKAGRERVVRLFSGERITKEWVRFYIDRVGS